MILIQLKCKQAASQGNVIAQNALGDIYYQGLDVEQDFIVAYKWWLLAEKNGFEDCAHKRSETAKKMTNVDIKQAKKLALQQGKH